MEQTKGYKEIGTLEESYWVWLLLVQFKIFILELLGLSIDRISMSTIIASKEFKANNF